MNILQYKLETTNDQLTSRASLLVTVHLMETLGLAKQIDRSLNREFNLTRHIQTLILMQHKDSFHLDDVRHLEDDKTLKTILGVKNLPKSTSIVTALEKQVIINPSTCHS